MKPTSTYQALILFILCWVPATVFAQAGDVVGDVTQLQGQADVVRNGLAPAAISQGDEVMRNDELITRAESQVQVRFLDGSSFVLDENSRVTVAQYAPGTAPTSLLQLARGRLRNTVSSAFSSRKDSYQVRTKEGVMGVQGTDFDVIALPGETLVYVYEGVVSAISLDPIYPETRLMGAGDFIRIRLGEPIQPSGQFFGVADGATTTSVGSGGVLDLISKGEQSQNPTVTVPVTPPDRGSEGVVVPPQPNPPSQR